MRKAIAMILALSFTMSLWAEQSAGRHEKGHPTAEDLRVPDRITPTSRDPENWFLYIEDTYGDGWGGSSLTLNVNDTEVGVYTLTPDEGEDSDGDGYIDDNYAIYEFEVDDWSYMVGSFAVNENGWPGECIYAFYDAEGFLVTFDTGSSGAPIDATVDQEGRMSVMANGGYEGAVGGWGMYPGQSFDVPTNGDGMYNSDDLFEVQRNFTNTLRVIKSKNHKLLVSDNEIRHATPVELQQNRRVNKIILDDDMSDDSHLENNISPLCKSYSNDE